MSIHPTVFARLAIIAVLASAGAIFGGGPAAAGQLPGIIANLAVEAKAQGTTFDAFSADRGAVLFSSRPATGKPDTPSCTSCHSASPKNAGQTRAGKEIAPMALSITADRYMDEKKVEKWFRRNCKSVLGRVCSPLEKGDFLTFMASQ